MRIPRGNFNIIILVDEVVKTSNELPVKQIFCRQSLKKTKLKILSLPFVLFALQALLGRPNQLPNIS